VTTTAVLILQPGPPNIDSGLLGMRFLTSILQAAEKHGLFPEAQPGNVMSKEAREPPQVSPSGALCCVQALPFLRYASCYFCSCSKATAEVQTPCLYNMIAQCLICCRHGACMYSYACLNIMRRQGSFQSMRLPGAVLCTHAVAAAGMSNSLPVAT